ncbi:MAG: M23 family metallopeptidase [Nocardioidaceae bacterium]
MSVAQLPVIPTVVGATALGLAGAGAAMDSGMNIASGPASTAQANLSSSSIAGALEDRTQAISRDNKRTSATTSAQEQLQDTVDAQAASRVTTLTKLGNQAANRSQEIVKNLWHVPTSGYRLTARFGMSSGLWAHNHTGLDFAAPSGTTIVAIANGTIISTEYDGAYGNKTVERLDDGTTGSGIATKWPSRSQSVTESRVGNQSGYSATPATPPAPMCTSKYAPPTGRQQTPTQPSWPTASLPDLSHNFSTGA